MINLRKRKKTHKKELKVKTLHVSAGARYFEDSTANGIEDSNHQMPCIKGDYWCPIINIDTGQIINWENGVEADIHYKVCDDGIYTIKDENNNVIITKEGYVPDCLCPDDEGYGDYIIMNINKDGFINKWKPDFEDFKDEED